MPVTIRPLEENDAEALFPLIYRSTVTETLLYNGPSCVDDWRRVVADRAAKTKMGAVAGFAIIEPEDGRPAGTVVVRPNPNGFRADIGIWLGIAFQGKGYGTVALRLAVEHGFRKMGLSKLEALVFTGNVASRRVFEKNGFCLEGTIRRGACKLGEYRDEWMFGLLDEEFSQLAQTANSASRRLACSAAGSLAPLDVT